MNLKYYYILKYYKLIFDNIYFIIFKFIKNLIAYINTKFIKLITFSNYFPNKI